MPTSLRATANEVSTPSACLRVRPCSKAEDDALSLSAAGVSQAENEPTPADRRAFSIRAARLAALELETTPTSRRITEIASHAAARRASKLSALSADQVGIELVLASDRRRSVRPMMRPPLRTAPAPSSASSALTSNADTAAEDPVSGKPTPRPRPSASMTLPASLAPTGGLPLPLPAPPALDLTGAPDRAFLRFGPPFPSSS